MTEPITITELSGSERSIELSDRALPHKGVIFSGEQRMEKTLYPGNPQATIQVLGPDELMSEFRGRWKDQFFAGREMVSLDGWDAIVSGTESPTVEQLVKVFHTLRRSGNLLEVRWGPEVRRGVMKRFEATYDRLDVVRWMFSCEWSQHGSASPSSFTGVTPTRTISAELTAALAEVNNLTAGRPQIMFPNFVEDLLELQGLIAVAVIELTESTASIDGTPEVTQDQFQGIASRAEDVVTNCETLRQALDVPGIGLVPVDDVSSVLAAQVWSKDVSVALIELAVAAVKARESIRDRTVSQYLADIRLRDGQTLRNIAREYYGTPDDWAIIADANGLVGSFHPSGTRVLVPRQSESGS